MPASLSRRTASRTFDFEPTTSSPPSVVTSSRRSGTSVAWWGVVAQAIVEHVVCAGQLQIDGHGDRFFEHPQIAILDVPAILAQDGA